MLDGGQGIAAYEWARVASVSGLTVNLTQPLIATHRGLLTQAVKVPEYTTLTVDPPSGTSPRSITAPAWNGSTGGIVVLLATGKVTLNGPIDVSGRGFRGGVTMHYTGQVSTCVADIGPPAGEMKGEGITAGRYGLSYGGPGNAANGGGGSSNCAASGGGSGSATYAASGGSGGGVVLIRAGALSGPGSILANGTSTGGSENPGMGGAGAGGAVFIKVQQTLACSTVSAGGGATVVDPRYISAGAPGGRVYLQGASVQCAVDVRPGPSGNFPTGGEPSSLNDPRYMGDVFIVSEPFAAPPAPVLTEPLPEAIVSTPRLTGRGTGSPGLGVRLYVDGQRAADLLVEADGRFAWPLTFDLTHGRHRFEASQLDNGVLGPRSASVSITVNLPWTLDGGPAEDAGLRLPPQFESAPGTTANCALPYRYSATGLPVVSGGEPLTFSVSTPVGGTLPAGLSVDPTTGQLTWVPTVADRGRLPVILRVDSPYGHDEQTFVIDVACGEATDVKVGCGCGAAPGALAAMAVLALVARARRRRATR